MMKVLSLRDLKRVKGISYSRPHLYRLMNAKKFPRPIKLGANCIAFVEREVDDWLQDKINARDRGPYLEPDDDSSEDE
jgi:prophage regulatory protein